MKQSMSDQNNKLLYEHQTGLRDRARMKQDVANLRTKHLLDEARMLEEHVAELEARREEIYRALSLQQQETLMHSGLR
jgi:hypothetical protein